MCGFLCVFRAFPVCALCSRVFSFLQSLPPPSIFPFQFVPLLRCVFHVFLVCVFCPVVSVFPAPCLLLFYSFCPSFFISPLCTPPDTYPALSLCVFCPDTSSSLLSFLSFLSPSLGFPFPLCVFSASLPPPSRCYSPFSPPPFPPLPPSFPRFPSPFLRSFPLLLLPLRKKFPLKSRVISSVKYMFYSIFLVCMRKFF